VRFLLVKGIKASVVTRYWDYKKFNVETSPRSQSPRALPMRPGSPNPPAVKLRVDKPAIQ